MLATLFILFSLPTIFLPSDSLGPYASESCGSPAAQKTAIVIHGGGYAIGSPRETDDTCKQLAENGFYVINLDYPLKDLAGAEAALRKETEILKARPGPLYAYGESAGGGLAALAAARGWVDGAFAWAPVSDLVSWRRANPGDSLVAFSEFKSTDRALLARLSAISYASPQSAPIVIVHGREDIVVRPEQSKRLVKRWPRAELRLVSGGHNSNEPSRIYAPRDALACFTGLSCPWAR